MKMQELDYAKLGEKAIRLALASHHANHKKVSSTVKDYVLPSDDHLEAVFLRDLFVLNTEEIIEKWFDGEENANAILAEISK
ncbi:hypothetical protein ABEX44_25700 [Priestia megaterium]